MQSKFSFTKDKFLSLSSQKRHKHLAALVKELYLESLGGNEPSLDLYNTWQSWHEEKPLQEGSPEHLSDRYHWHLKKADVNLSEGSFLPKVLKNDKAKGATPLPWTIYLDNLRSAFNVGSIIRTVEAFALGKVVFGDKCPSINHTQVKSTAMHTDEWVETDSGKLSDLPRPIIALETVEGAIPHNDFHFPKEGTLVLGNEEYGCSENTLKMADAIISIPLYGRKNSLNVANAFSIVAETIRRGAENDR